MGNLRLLLPLLGMVYACQQGPGVADPKPYGYPRLILPQDVVYQEFSADNCPFTLEYPNFGEVNLYKEDSCWIDIHFPLYDCTWHLTYRSMAGDLNIRERSLEEHRSLTYKHSKKASNILTSALEFPSGRVNYYEVFGNIGTPAQWFLTDSQGRHILMGSFYFNHSVQNDSLVPVTNYMKKEFLRMAGQIKWD